MKEKLAKILFSVTGIIMIFVTLVCITPYLEEKCPNTAEQFYISGNGREILKKTLNIDIPEDVEIIEFEQDDDAWYNFQLKCESFKNSRTVLRENISEAYVLGKNQPDNVYDLHITSVYDIPGFIPEYAGVITNENLVCYYTKSCINSDIELVYKHMPVVTAFVTKENGKEYIYISII